MTQDEKYLISTAVSLVNAAIFEKVVLSPSEIQKLLRQTYRTLSTLADGVPEENIEADSLHATA